MKKCFSESVSLLLLLTLVGCKADKVQGNSGKGDAGVLEVLDPPLLDLVPEVTPNGTVAIRGSSEGSRIVIQGGADGTNIVAVLPGGGPSAATSHSTRANQPPSRSTASVMGFFPPLSIS